MKQPFPPRLAQALFAWFCKGAIVEDLKGDMDELFIRNLARMSESKARWIYWRQVLSLIFSYAIKSRKKQQTVQDSSLLPDFSMLSNYVVTAKRNLAKQRFFTIINVIGLATGMSVSLLFLAIVSFIQTYDDFQVNKDRIYRVITHVDTQEYSNDFASSPAPLYEKLSTLTGIDKIVRISKFSDNVSYENRELLSLRGYFADPAFLTVFTFPLQQGDKRTALSLPNSLVITPAAALRIFGTEDAIGKTLQVGDKGLFEITGVFRELPKNTHFDFEAVASYTFIDRSIDSMPNGQDPWKEFWSNYIYVQFDPTGDAQADAERTEKALADIAVGQYAASSFKASFSLQSIKDITPGIELSNCPGRDWGGYAGLTAFFVLTLFILLPACFNYTNISISRALKRSKEIGLRKVMGGQRSQIFSQFVLETVIITLMALVGGCAIFIAVRNQVIASLTDGNGLDLSLTFNMISWFFLFAVVVGLITGIVPAIYFSKLNPIDSLKRVGQAGTLGSLNIRKVLITAQFALSLIFIMCVVVAYRQHQGSIGYDFGFNRENILTVDIHGTDPQLFRNQFSRFSEVRAMSYSSHIPGASSAESTFVVNTTGDSTEVFRMFADHGQITTFGLTLLAGTNFNEDYSKCGNDIIVNEAFVRQFKLGRPLDAVGRVFMLSGGPSSAGGSAKARQEVRVAGVMKDFQYLHLEEGIKSFFYQCDPQKFRYAFLAVQSQELFSTLSLMEAAWKSIGGERKFISKFLNDYIQEAYDFHLTVVKICAFLGGLAISISCLGMLGMVVFTVENRVKEVGVRKVMGATSGTIAYLLSKDFIKLMLIASAVAIPITWLFFENIYLRIQNYTVPIGAFEILTSLAILFVLGLSTVLSQTFKAAAANPVDSLRHE